MCGRFTIAITVGFYDRFSVEERSLPLQVRYNVAPSQDAPVIVRQDSNQALLMRWGLIPSWAKDAKISYRMINARADTLAVKPAFRIPLQKSRCLVPATGFYEWKETGGKKAPYYIRRKDSALFAFAGLYDTWKSPEGREVISFTIITTEPNGLIRSLHDRMPAILRREDETLWLQEGKMGSDELERILSPYPVEDLIAYPVSLAVNNPGNDSEDLICPLES